MALPTSSSVDDLCRQRNISFDELVEKSGLERTRVMAIYLGRWTPSPTERDRIAAVFDVPKDEITWGHKTPIQHIYGSGPA
jgi:transcriptional regulator with XRE-family HTH domain